MSDFQQEEVDLDLEKQDLLVNVFKEIKIEKCDERNKEWIRQIQDNYFAFNDFSDVDKSISYDKQSILDDIFVLAENIVLGSFFESEWKNFYDAINEHYDFVRARLIANGINILSC